MAGTRPGSGYPAFITYVVFFAAVFCSVFFPAIVFNHMNNAHSSTSTLDLDSSVQTMAYQIPTLGGTALKVMYTIGSSVKSTLGNEVTGYVSSANDLVINLEDKELTDALSDGANIAPDGIENRLPVDNTGESCGDQRFNADEDAIQTAVSGSLGLPTIKGQRGVGIPSHNAKAHDKVMRNLNAIAACHKMDFALEFPEDTKQVDLSKKTGNTYGADTPANLVKDGYMLDGYLADYHPFAMDVKDTVSVRCIALKRIDTVKADTCSIFRTDAQKAASAAEATHITNGEAHDDNNYADNIYLTKAKIEGIKNQASNCPIICDAREEDDYLEDRKHGAFGAHVRSVKSTQVKECIAGIHEAMRETLDTDDITVRQVLTSITRDQKLGDKLHNTMGYASSLYYAGTVACLFVLFWLFGFSLKVSSSGARDWVNFSKTAAQLVFIFIIAIFGAVSQEIYDFKHDTANSAVQITDTFSSCPVTSSSAQTVSDAFYDWSIAQAILPAVLLTPMGIGLFMLIVPYFIAWVVCKAWGYRVEFCEYFNPMNWYQRGWDAVPYSLSLLSGQASDADPEEMVAVLDTTISLKPWSGEPSM